MAYTKVIVIGGGFGGLNFVKGLKKCDFDITLMDKTNHHTFQPLLYQVATAVLSSTSISTPLREIFRWQENVYLIMANVVKIDTDRHEVITEDGASFHYDYLVLAVGATHSYFGHPEWESMAPGLKTLEDAVTIREDILLTFERAERCDSISEAQKMLRFAIVGGGPTGVEMAGAIAEIARKSMYKNFRKIKPEQTKIFLIEGLDRILSMYTPELSEKAKKDLEKLGVKVLLNHPVTNMTPEGVWLGTKFLQVSKVIWAAGNEASSLLKTLEVPLDRQGRVIVEKDLSIPGHPDVFVIGDAAHVKNEQGVTIPAIAPVAIQQGKYLAKIIKNNVPPEKRAPFIYFDKGQMATIGKHKAVAMIGKHTFSGYFAWLAWGLIHIWYLISFANRLVVMINWIFWYITGQRQMRLIIGRIKPKDLKTAPTSNGRNGQRMDKVDN